MSGLRGAVVLTGIAMLGIPTAWAAGESCTPALSWDAAGIRIDGKREFLISGEIHYFRVPKEAWRARLRQLKAVGGNCVATYVPWCVHEPEEGKFLFGDCPSRDLGAFLRTVEEEGLKAIVRPGPYQYSELVYHGLPRWLVEGHPEIGLKRTDGTPVRLGSVDYNHPYFLAKTRAYFKAVADVIRSHMAADGGSLLVAPDFPRTDEKGGACTVLADAVGAPAGETLGALPREEPVCRAGEFRIYGLTPCRRFGELPNGGLPTLVSEGGGRIYGCRWQAGKGRVSQLGATWSAKFFSQSDMLSRELEALGAKPVVESSNRNVLTTVYRLKDGSLGVFVLNLQSSPQETVVRAPGGRSRRFVLKAMEVGYGVLQAGEP